MRRWGWVMAAVGVLACGSADEPALFAGTGGATSDAAGSNGAGASGDSGTGGIAGTSGAAGSSAVAGVGAAGSSGSSGSGAGATGGSDTSDAGADAAPLDAPSDAPLTSCGVPALTPGTHAGTVRSSNTTREFRVRLPPSYDGTAPLPVVLVFHGYLETGRDIERISELSPSTDRAGVIAVYAEGISTSWNAGSCCGSSSIAKRPDVAFVRDLLDALPQRYCIDDQRVYATGFSNGGMLSHRLACELSDRIAAIAPVAGTLAIDTCTPSRPVPMLHFHGTSDFVVSYGGGGLSGARGVDDTVNSWATRNRCSTAPATEWFRNGDVSCTERVGCAAPVRLCKVDGGGHQWPGGTSAGPGGKLTQDVDAAETMLRFFAQHRLP